MKNDNFKISKKSFKNFISKNNFYVVLGICVLIVGATAVFVSMQNVPLPEDKYSQSQSGENESLSPPDNSSSQSVNTVDSSLSSENTTAEKLVTFTAPVQGEILVANSLDKLLYDVTMNDWRPHRGIDIAAENGTAVKCSANGTIEDITNDPGMGKTVTINNGSGYKTIYSNLGDTSTITKGKEIKQGDVIGSVGTSASYESSEAPHLHFQILKNNADVNPAELIKYFKNASTEK